MDNPVEQDFWSAAVKHLEIETKEVWAPQPGPQQAFIDHTDDVFEIMYGGARGGGKTDAMLGDWIVHQRKYGKNARGAFFRRVALNLRDVIRRSKELFPKLGAQWNGSSQEWTFPNGSTLKILHLWDEGAAANYQGWQMSRIYAEELQAWPDPAPIQMIKAILRSAEGVPVGFRASANPGGPGQNWVAARYVFPAPGGYKRIWDPEIEQELMFIPARLEDNEILMRNDPSYEARLRGSGPEYLVKAWRYGDWNIAAGGYFDDVFRSDKHIIKPFTVPESWHLRRSFDWGFSKPSSMGVWAISDGTVVEEQGLYFPRGSMIRIKEWYTAERKNGVVVPNHGMKLSNQDLGLGIARMSLETLHEYEQDRFRGCVADPAIFTAHGGPSIYDQMRSSAFMLQHRLYLNKADNSRIAGWQQMRKMLQEAAKDNPEEPGLWVCETCTDWIRTVPIIGRDDRNQDDIDSKSEDHCADECRYAVMSGLGPRVQVQEFMM